MPRVDKICGPGNRFVTAGKGLVANDCAIDMPAGPTEVLVLAIPGRKAAGKDAGLMAADLLAQAEHDPDAVALLVTTSPPFASAIAAEIARQLRGLPQNNPAWKSLRSSSAILVAPSVDVAVRFANLVAPEHLSIPFGALSLLEKLTAAGSLFLGPCTPPPIGDYCSGTNHVLPTSASPRAP